MAYAFLVEPSCRVDLAEIVVAVTHLGTAVRYALDLPPRTARKERGDTGRARRSGWQQGGAVAEERFLPPAMIAQELALSHDQVIALITAGDLPAVKILGSWRVERWALEQFICRMYIGTALDLHSASHDVGSHDVDTPAGKPGDDIPRTDTRSASRRTVDEQNVDLTPQMQRVLELVAWGRSNAEIAEELTVEVSTVKSHVSRLLSRLDCRDRQHLIAFAWSTGLVHRGEIGRRSP